MPLPVAGYFQVGQLNASSTEGPSGGVPVLLLVEQDHDQTLKLGKGGRQIAALVGCACSLFSEANELSMGALSRQSPRRLMD
jgi:hypothetical protein